ncbi:hypothetical protein C4577_03760 [Candidatus Parcubacteria bacterium]|nr:MAG: hypothetical protein C4577_03760 [Candidatus Parcubacteria bacterium]
MRFTYKGLEVTVRCPEDTPVSVTVEGQTADGQNFLCVLSSAPKEQAPEKHIGHDLARDVDTMAKRMEKEQSGEAGYQPGSGVDPRD